MPLGGPSADHSKLVLDIERLFFGWFPSKLTEWNELNDKALKVFASFNPAHSPDEKRAWELGVEQAKRQMLQPLLDIMNSRQEILSLMQRATAAEAAALSESGSPLRCSSVDFLGFTNAYVDMLEDEYQAREAVVFDLLANPEDVEFPALKASWQHQPFLNPNTCRSIELRIELHQKKKR